ncbi:magnesium/cobalt transporter CorA [Pelotomaculum isophthalicicum JI]|uniref:Magnesium transport protein CorA n=1 Tax=Pelotomaculum isophthalicicum JI TaxID=947010 RepID=A0A9X4H088_9FIRM|nr:magnesium/cobalt transporter CorA [Pelotomaculum isophthalicicum]MDF9409620.1 magnesium/cobalt transporter CorA [Pelotomaculum isophthalicicum JI]
MYKSIGKISKKAGLSPGSLIYIGEERNEKTKITLFNYDEQSFQEKQIETVDECLSFKDSPAVTWINIDGLHQVEIVENIGQCFGLHPLLLEDILDTGHRPKMEDYGEYVHVILKMLFFDENSNNVVTEQISIILGSHYVLSFQEREGEIFNQLKERIRSGLGRVRKMGADYLFYALIDSIVDSYFVVLEKLGEKIELLEERLVTNPSPVTLKAIHKLKTGMIFLSKSVWPLREVISGLERGETPLIKEPTGIYLRDVYDHTIQVIDTLETYRDMITGMLDIYLTSINNKISEIMKVLTVITTIFIPLTFIAGVYGMNFEYMPELQWRWGYPAVLSVMIIIGVLMGFYFKRRKWL